MSERRPHLLFVVSEDWYFCSHRLALAVAARDAGFEVSVATREGRHGDLIRAGGIRLIPLSLSRHGTNPLRDLAFILKLRALYRREQPDVVHHVAIKPVLYGTLAARSAGIGGIVNALGGLGFLFSSGSLKARLLKPAIRLAFRVLLGNRASRIILQNPEDRAVLAAAAGLEEEDLFLIRGAGVDLAQFHPRPLPDGVPVVLLPSRLLWDKGVGEFAEAAKRLREQGVNCRCVLVGKPDEGNPRSVPESRIRAWVDSGILEWWGFSDDMAATLAQAAIVCLPTFYGEGIPKSLLEAAASGLPIVTTDTPGCREIVRHGDNGLLVPARNGAALAEALEALIVDPDRRRRFGARSRAIAEAEFGSEKTIAQTLEIYRTLVHLY